ncbi:MAG TPA: hypothetical protein PK431_06775 [Chitinophagales bacterium]|nr:hypothetical protein [Chitinophagales bacterium]
MNLKKYKKRIYAIEDAILITISKVKIAFLRRDIVKLTEFNVTPAALDDFDATVDAFAEFPTDSESAGDKAIATETKNASNAALSQAIQTIMVRVENKFGTHSAKYRSFNTSRLYYLDDANLLLLGRHVANRATLYLADLASLGLTTAEIDALRALCTAFENSILEQQAMIAERDIMQEDRVVMGNAIFTQLRNYCKLAKSAWRTVSAAKYNDYVIYDTPSGEKTDDAAAVTEL